MMTAYQTIPNAVRAIRHGAEDYIVKEASVAPSSSVCSSLRRRAQLRDEARRGGRGPSVRACSGAQARCAWWSTS